jgi:NAD(P)H dehydrogenase (quinone)
MSKILVTGATGHLGRQTIEFLRKRVSDDRIVALARDPDSLSGLAASGIEVRRGDYMDRDSLVAAYAGIAKVLLVSASAFTDRLTQHVNVIEAAKQAGVRHLVYTSIQRKAVSPMLLPTVTEYDIATEAALKASGLDWTILFNALYLDAIPMILGDVLPVDGVRVPGGVGKGDMVSRQDLAEANAVVLTESGHENKSYTLGASEAVSFADMAKIFSRISGKSVPYVETSVRDYVAAKVKAGLPEPVAGFLAEWARAVAVGEYAEVTGDLERLIGHKPTSCAEFLTQSYAHAA